MIAVIGSEEQQRAGEVNQVEGEAFAGADPAPVK
jgi:hypothetical protein